MQINMRLRPETQDMPANMNKNGAWKYTLSLHIGIIWDKGFHIIIVFFFNLFYHFFLCVQAQKNRIRAL